MKLWLIFFLCFLGTALHADWHTWEDEPESGSLYMVIHAVPGYPPHQRQTLIVQRWGGRNNVVVGDRNGWWDVTQTDLWKWMNEGSKLLYLPSGKEDFEYLGTIIYQTCLFPDGLYNPPWKI